MRISDRSQTARFRELHGAGRPLILPNAGDAGSALNKLLGRSPLCVTIVATSPVGVIVLVSLFRLVKRICPRAGARSGVPLDVAEGLPHAEAPGANG